MTTKRALTDSYILWGGTDRSNQFGSFMPNSVRAQIEDSVFGSSTDTIAPGTFAHETAATLRPDADQVFLKVMLNQYIGEAAVAVVYQQKDASGPTAPGTAEANYPTMSFSVQVTEAPPLGGARNTLIEKQVTYKIVTPITWYDGTTTIVIG
jgi:hypothetical protein